MRLKSLTTQLFLITAITIIAFVVYIYTGFIFTSTLKDEARRINLAGRAGVQLIDIALGLEEMAGLQDGAEREAVAADVREKMRSYESILFNTKVGGDAHGYPFPGLSESADPIDSIIASWNSVHKPAILKLLTFPDQAGAREYHRMAHRQEALLNSLISGLEREFDGRLLGYDIFRIYLIAFFSLLIFYIVLFIRNHIVTPMLKLREAAKRIEGGEFAVAFDTSRKDEIGDLSRDLSRMAITLEGSFGENKRLIEDLRKREASLAEAQRIGHMGSWEWDIVKEELSWSDEIYRIFGLKPGEFGSNYEAFMSFVHPDDRALVQRNVDTALKGGEAYSTDHRIVLPDGTLRVVREQAEVVFDNGEAVRMIGTVQDITERKRAEEEICRYNEEVVALNQASNAIMGITKTEDLYRAICESAQRLFRLRMTWIGLVEKGSFALKPVASAGHEAGYLSTIKVTWDDSPTGMGPGGGSIKTKEPCLSDVDDPLFAPWREEAKKRGYFSILSVPLMCSPEDCIGALIMYSENKDHFSPEMIRLCQVFANQAAVAIERARLIEELEEKVRERTQELEDARLMAEAANRAKSDFLANMSHELRTPLNSIIGFSEILQERLFGELNAKQAEFVEYVVFSGRHLLSLINDILDLSKVESGKMELQVSRFVLRNAIQSSLSMFKEKALKHNISLNFEMEGDEALEVEADERKIRQVLFNLLSNAVKFTSDGGSVTVTVRKTDEEHAEVSVKDTGIGIKPEDMPNLFDQFFRAESPYTKKYEGVGLGLALTKKIVELHGGRIWVESEPGKGSIFSFSLPLRQSRGEEVNYDRE